jgi:RNA polymerase sigma factor (sigma-70 family)
LRFGGFILATMPMPDPSHCLRDFAATKSSESFEPVVRQYLGIVFAAALRRTGGQRQLAEEVAQDVFCELSRRADRLADHPLLVGWLYSHTRFTAMRLMRTEKRRHDRERAATELETITAASVPIEWTHVQPAIDAAIDTLSAGDRTVVLLRFFEGRSFSEVGRRVGLTEDGARGA